MDTNAPPLYRLLQAAFHLLYHQFSWTYDWVAAIVSVGMWKEWVFSVMPALEGRRVLEVGFGPGHLQARANDLGLQIVGIDESMQMCRKAHKRLTNLSAQPGVLRGLGQAIPFRAAYFDQVVATFPAPYIAAPETLAEIHRVLAPEGSFILLLGALITGKGLFDRLAALLFQITGLVPKESSIPRDLLNKTFANAGFSVQLKEIPLKRSTALQLIAKK